MERREALYSGNVQGVGFRYTARRIAAGFPVTGFVQNLPDGRVLLVAEGTPEALDGFLSAVVAELGRHIRAVEVALQSASGEYVGFGVRM